MKKLIVSAALILGLGLISQTAQASNPESLKNILTDLIGTPDLHDVDDEVTFKVVFTVNDKNEIVVLSTTHPHFDKFVKTRLNYETLVHPEIRTKETYILPVTMVRR